MAIEIKHAFVSAKGDGSDATLVRPSNWNAIHGIEMVTNAVIGRLTAGPGAAEELPVTSFMMGLLATADFAALAEALGLPTTGDAKLTYKAVADPGWVLANDGSIGNAASGATLAAATTQALFTLFYNGFSDANAPVQTSTGAATTRGAQGAAATAYGNACRMVLPKTLGRALIIAGTGAGLATRTLGSIGGEETHTLTAAESVAHTHTAAGWTGVTGAQTVAGTISGTWTLNSGLTGSASAYLHTHGVSGMTAGGGVDHTHTAFTYVAIGGGTGVAVYGRANQGFGSDNALTTNPASAYWHDHSISGTAASGGVDHTHTLVNTAITLTSGACSVPVPVLTVTGVGGTTAGAVGFTGAAHNIMQPWTAWNIMIRL